MHPLPWLSGTNKKYGFGKKCCDEKKTKKNKNFPSFGVFWFVQQLHWGNFLFLKRGDRPQNPLFLYIGLTITPLQMKGRWESNINVYSQKWNYAASLFPKENYNVPSPNSCTHRSVRELFISRICSQICGPILGIYKSLTNTWMWKLGLKAETISRKGIHKWDFRCSVPFISDLGWFLGPPSTQQGTSPQALAGCPVPNTCFFWVPLLRLVFGSCENVWT